MLIRNNNNEDIQQRSYKCLDLQANAENNGNNFVG